MDLIDFAEEYRETYHSRFKAYPSSFYVPGRGSERPTVMLLGDAPSATDTHARRAVAGQPGRILNQLMELAGLRTEDDMDELDLSVLKANAYVTNMVKYRPGPFPLTTPEVIKALPWVKKEWEILGSPPVIVPLGLNPTMCLLGVEHKLSEVVGEPHPIAAGGPVIWPMLHPSYPMHEPRMRPVCEEHWQAFGAWLKEEGLA